MSRRRSRPRPRRHSSSPSPSHDDEPRSRLAAALSALAAASTAQVKQLFGVFGFRNSALFLGIVALIFTSLVLAGCSSTATFIPQLHLASLRYDNTTSDLGQSPELVRRQTLSLVAEQVGSNATLEVLVGFFGTCLTTATQPGYICSRDVEALAAGLDASQDPLNLLWQAQRLRRYAVFSPLLFIFLALFAVSLVLLYSLVRTGAHVLDDEGDVNAAALPSVPRAQLTAGLISVSAALLLVSTVLNHSAAAGFITALDSFAPGKVNAHLGSPALGLQWAATVLALLVAAGSIIIALVASAMESVFADFDGSASTSSTRSRRQQSRSLPVVEMDRLGAERRRLAKEAMDKAAAEQKEKGKHPPFGWDGDE